MSNPTVIVGSPVTVASLPTAGFAEPDDYAIIDGVTHATRKILASALAARSVPLQMVEVPSISDFPPIVQTRIAEMSAGELLMLLVAKQLFTEDELVALANL